MEVYGLRQDWHGKVEERESVERLVDGELWDCESERFCAEGDVSPKASGTGGLRWGSEGDARGALRVGIQCTHSHPWGIAAPCFIPEHALV